MVTVSIQLGPALVFLMQGASSFRGFHKKILLYKLCKDKIAGCNFASVFSLPGRVVKRVKKGASQC